MCGASCLLEEKKMKKGLFTCFVILITLVSGNALADTTSYTLNNINLAGYTGPYASVAVDLTSPTTANITFDAMANGSYQFLFVGVNAADVNVNADSWRIGNIAFTQIPSAGFSAPTLSPTGSGNVSSWGDFNQTIRQSGAFSDATNRISFTLTDLDGTWASASDVLLNNTDGFAVAAHVAITTIPVDRANGAIVTGFATTGGSVSVPEPMSLLFLGACLTGIAAVSRRKK
jgi:hypothetical protein